MPLPGAMRRNYCVIDPKEEKKKMDKKNIKKEHIKAYTMALEYIKNEINSYCTSRGANYMFVSTKESVDRIILHEAIKKEIVK